MRFFVIAGESSGDLIGSEIIKSLTKKGEVFGIGGECMLSSGLKYSLFKMEEIAIMGFFEILPKIFKIKKLISSTVSGILDINPDYVITIDSPGFNTRVVNLLRRSNFKGKIYHVVAPTVWAYKEKRSKKFAALYDKLFCILPFEPPFFLKEGLWAKYICYPPLIRLLPNIQKIPTQDVYFILTLGSRKGEVMRHLTFAKNLVKILKDNIKGITFVIPTFKEFEIFLKKELPNEIIVTSEEERIFYLQRASFCISKSGTGAVENSFFSIPSVIYYKVNFLSFLLIKSLIKIKFANLVNIILNQEIIPEFIQYKATPKSVAKKVLLIYHSKPLIEEQVKAVEDVKNILLSKESYKNFGDGIIDNL